jgi:hypothetical protein
MAQEKKSTPHNNVSAADTHLFAGEFIHQNNVAM